MNVLEKLKNLIPRLQDDGSKEVAQSWIESAAKAAEIDQLMSNPVFARILESIRIDAKARLHELAMKDPEITAMRKLLVRTIGRQRSAEQVSQMIDDYLTKQEEERKLAEE